MKFEMEYIMINFITSPQRVSEFHICKLFFRKILYMFYRIIFLINHSFKKTKTVSLQTLLRSKTGNLRNFTVWDMFWVCNILHETILLEEFFSLSYFLLY